MTTSHTKIKILHLEDLPSDADLVARMLLKATFEFELKLVSNRAQYTEALESFKPQLILSDHNLPAFNSIEALEVLQKSNLKVPFVLVTGAVSEEFAVAAMRAGADDYILKDRLQRLPVAIHNVLEKYRLERERKKSETLIRNIDANSLDMICSVSEDGYFLHVSAASEAILGYTPAELIGKKPFDFVYAEDKQKTIDSANYVMAGNLLNNFQNRYVRKDGSLVTLSWSTRWDEHDRVRYGVARDVTEKNITDEKIKQAETLLRNIDANSADMICSISEDGLFIHVSAACERILGYTAAELIGKRLLDFVYSKDQAKTQEAALRVMNGNPVSSFENSCVRKDGSRVPLLWSVRWDANDRIWYGVARDATEKNQSLKIITDYKRTLDASSIVAITDQSGIINYVNDSFCTISKYSKEELIGQDHRIISSGYHSKEFIRNLWVTIANGKIWKGDLKNRAKDGTTYWVGTTIIPFLNDEGKPFQYFSIRTDITEQKEIEEENKKLATVASLTVNAVIVTDAEGRISWVNKGFERITEYSFEDVLGKKPGDFLQGNATNPITVTHMGDCIREGKGFGVEVINYSKSGRQYWLDIEVVPLRDDRYRLTGFMAIEQDITDRKRTEGEALSLIKNLQKRNSDLQQFSYIVSHNLRAPIAKIMGLASIIQSENEENNSLIDKISQESANLDEVVKDINLIVSARKTDKEKFEYVLFTKEVNNVMQILETEIEESEATITYYFSEIESAFTIKSYLHSILYNLISNAIKYRRPGVAPHIEIKSSQDDKFICLFVQDNGEGIDLAKNGSKIFGLYKRFHKGSVPGKGIGLSLVKTHAESLGGRVEIESELAIGTTFRVYIPKHHDEKI